jgi:hypothetical protein
MEDFCKLAGKPWRNKIREEIHRANWFILLLPDPSEDWDWCLYETGMFEGDLTSADRLICLHHPDTKIPDAIKDYQAVSATVPEISAFLRMIFVDKDPIPGMEPINRSIDNDIDKIAKEIVDAIRPPKAVRERYLFGPWIKLEVPGATGLQSESDLDSATILEANTKALELFDWEARRPTTWGELKSGVEDLKVDSRWLKELFHVIRKISSGRGFRAIQAVFHAHGAMYRPLVFAIDKNGNASAAEVFHITFVEEVGAFDSTAMPQGLSTLVTLLSMAFRFRWEVLEQFTKRGLTESDVERVSNVLARLEQDSASRGIVDQFAVVSLFPPEQAQRINEMFVKWGQLRDPIDRQGKLDVAIRNKDPGQVSALLKEMTSINQEFLKIAANRFSEVVAYQQ